MQRFSKIVPVQSNTAVALGFFDGVHRGHREVIARVVGQKQNGLVPVCFTFAQSPKSILQGVQEKLLMTNADKLKTLDEIGVEQAINVDFRTVMNICAEDFVKEILVSKLRAKLVVCGFNYRFGKNGEGTSELLKSLCEQNGVKAIVVPPKTSGGRIVSSTLIRELIAQGDVKTANELMCSRFGFCSVIEHGKKLGRKLGTPTINQPLADELTDVRFGVYASAVTLEDGKTYCGVSNIGTKPTVGKFEPRCETWMPDYRGGEIYGETADIRLLEFIRDEKKFSDIDELKNAIIQNAVCAKQIYENTFSS